MAEKKVWANGSYVETILTFIAAVGEVPSGGIDTPATIALSNFISDAGIASFANTDIAAALKSFSQGNSLETSKFAAVQGVGELTKSAVSLLPGANTLADLVGGLASEAKGLMIKSEKSKCSIS